MYNVINTIKGDLPILYNKIYLKGPKPILNILTYMRFT